MLDCLNAKWLMPARACALDLSARALRLEADERLEFDGLVIATGVSPRRFPSPVPAGVGTLRGLDDAAWLRAALAKRPTVAVVGSGVLGMEFAATVRKLGLDVTVISNARYPLARRFPAAIRRTSGRASPPARRRVAALTQVAGFEERGGALSGVRAG